MILSRMGASKLLGLLDALQQDKFYIAAKGPPSTASRPQDRSGNAAGSGAMYTAYAAVGIKIGNEAVPAKLCKPHLIHLASSMQGWIPAMSEVYITKLLIWANPWV